MNRPWFVVAGSLAIASMMFGLASFFVDTHSGVQWVFAGAQAVITVAMIGALVMDTKWVRREKLERRR